MTALALPRKQADRRSPVRQFVTFQVGPMRLAVAISDIYEINRNLDVTLVPHSPATVRGVVNLRGNVVTVMNLHALLGMEPTARTRDSRNLIVCVRGELIGLWVDHILDAIDLSESQIEPSPANIQGVDGRFFAGVFTQDSAVAVIVLLEQLLAVG
jgi:purine-binding chemotaxis protein CheW